MVYIHRTAKIACRSMGAANRASSEGADENAVAPELVGELIRAEAITRGCTQRENAATNISGWPIIPNPLPTHVELVR
jgi:hypothetical protein